MNIAVVIPDFILKFASNVMNNMKHNHWRCAQSEKHSGLKRLDHFLFISFQVRFASRLKATSGQKPRWNPSSESVVCTFNASSREIFRYSAMKLAAPFILFLLRLSYRKIINRNKKLCTDFRVIHNNLDAPVVNIP